MKKAKIVAVAAAAVMAVSAVGAMAGCKDEAHTISILLLCNSRESRFYTKYFQDYEAQLQSEGYDYAIDFQYNASADYFNALETKINGNQIPDIFYVRPNNLMQYHDFIVSLQDYADTQEEVDLDNIQPQALDMYRYDPETGTFGGDNDLYAFPKDLSTQQLGYNKTFLTKYTTQIHDAGLSLPWEGDYATGQKTYKWDEYKTMCQVITNAIKAENPNAALIEDYAMDVPPIEVIVKSLGGELIDLSGGRANGTVSSLTEGVVAEALQYQAELVDAGAHHENGYSNFTGGHLGFYGLIGSWEIDEHNQNAEAKGYEWALMPWPTEDGSPNWQGIITSAGYVVSKNCAENAENPEKGEIAKRIAISFMTPTTQNQLVRDEQISLPLEKSMEAVYRSADSNEIYKPETRGFFLDVVTGAHGFVPAEYSTYNEDWLTPLNDAITIFVNKFDGSSVSTYGGTNWTSVRESMQTRYNDSKNK